MTSLNFVHYEAIVSAYESFVQGESNWVLLRYADANQPDDLSLVGHGPGGLAELKSSIADLDQVYIAFYHEEIPVRPGYILINYIPPSVSGVKRARTFVHSRRFSAVFKVAHATLTVDHLGNLTPTAIHQAVLNPDSNHTIEFAPTPDKNFFDELEPDSGAESGSEMPSTRTRSASLSPIKNSKMFASLLKRKMSKSATMDEFAQEFSEEEDAAPPPPPPPKDADNSVISRHYSSSQNFPISAAKSLPRPGITDSVDLSEFVHVTRPRSQTFDDSAPPRPPKSAQPLPSARPGSHFLIPVDRKWTTETVLIPDPEERARRRLVAQKQKQIEEEMSAQEERERQTKIKMEREEQARREAREEAERRASIEQEIRRATSERRKKEQMEREEEERKHRELEEKKIADRKRRQEEHHRLEEWRKELEKSAEESVRKEKTMLEVEQMERRKRVQAMAARIKKDSKSEDLTTGWATMQIQDTLVWRRRYYRLAGQTLFFYRSPKETSHALDCIELRKRVRALREWNEGYEELKAIPHSFAVEFNDGRESISLFADTDGEKDKLLGLIHYAAGL